MAFVVRYGGYGRYSWGHQLARHPRVLKQSWHCKHLGRFNTMHKTVINPAKKGTVRLYIAAEKDQNLTVSSEDMTAEMSDILY